ncbi:MAG: hypothetical protein QM495_12785 [Lutibacter sp.]|uniref:hypothetical protein n=1 Tax=Lutibacter sp. TaxID=1925666 RepID=UPI00385B6245
MKNILFFLLVAFSLHAQSLLVDKCINDNYYVSNDLLYYQESNTTVFQQTSLSAIDNIKHGFFLTDNGCQRTLKYGIEISEFNYLMAFCGVLIGFLILVLVIWGV